MSSGLKLPVTLRAVNASCDVDTQCVSNSCSKAHICQAPALGLQAAAQSVPVPVGYVDGLGGGNIAGWAYDPANPSVSIRVDFYRGPSFANFVGSTMANQARPDVNDAFKITGNHGFKFQIPASGAQNGAPYYAYAINVNGTTYAPLANTPVTLGMTANIDSIVGNTVAGWVVDPTAPTQSAKVLVYADPNFQTLIGSVSSTMARPDVNVYFDITGNHGFTFPIPDAYLGSEKKLYFYAEPVAGSAARIQIPGSPLTLGAVTGYVDGIQNQTISGWAFHPYATNVSFDLRIYGGPDSTTLIGTTTANLPRPDVNAFFHITGSHGFAFKLPANAVKEGYQYRVYAVVTPKPPYPQLTNSPITIQRPEILTPQAKLTVNGQTGLIQAAVGQKLTYAWSSVNAVTASSTTYTDIAPAPQPWVAGVSAGSTTATVPASSAGHTFTYTYQAKGAGGLTAIATVRVAVAPQNPPLDESGKNLLGINLAVVTDNAPEAYYADLARTARTPFTTTSPLTPVAIDENGWPTVDSFNFYIWSAKINNNLPGAYAMSFNGHATAILPRDLFSPLTYDPATNTTTTTMTLKPGDARLNQNMLLTFQQAYRDSGTSHPGVTDIKIMRPDPDTGIPFPREKVFNTSIFKVLKKFSVVRYMDFTRAMDPGIVDWSQRRPPTYTPSYPSSPGKSVGTPWEYVVQLSNETQTDPWINIPASASDDYIIKLAQLFAYGSDGLTALPYTGPFGSAVSDENPRPAAHDPSDWVEGTTTWYPPLNADRKLYVELGNELWVSGALPYAYGFNAIEDIQKNTPLEAPCHYGSLALPKSYRVTGCEHAANAAKRVAQISLLFRKVFGDGAMMTRVRPFLGGQAAFAGGTGGMGGMFAWAFDYLANGEGHGWPGPEWVFPGTNTPVGPRPLSYYYYGAGGSSYYRPTDSSTVISHLTSGSMDVAKYGVGSPVGINDMFYPLLYGVRRIAYEGGSSFSASNDLTRQAAMTARPNVPNMTDILIQHHDAWSAWGGDLSVFYDTSSVNWGFLAFDSQHPNGNVYAATSPKLDAIDELNAKPRAAIGSVGFSWGTTPFGAEVSALDFTMIPNGWGATNQLGWGGGSKRLYFTSVDGGLYLDAKAAVNSNVGFDSFPGYVFDNNSETYTSGVYLYTAYAFSKASARSPAQVVLKLAEATDSQVEVFFDGNSLGTQSAANGIITLAAGDVSPGVHGVIVKAAAGRMRLLSLKVQ